MRRTTALLLVVAALGLLALGGCRRSQPNPAGQVNQPIAVLTSQPIIEPQERVSPSADKTSNSMPSTAALNPDEMRAALLTLADKERDPTLNSLIEPLRSMPVVSSGGQSTIGPWHLDGARRTFIVSLVRPPLFIEYTGAFIRTADGQCEARITRKRQS